LRPEVMQLICLLNRFQNSLATDFLTTEDNLKTPDIK